MLQGMLNLPSSDPPQDPFVVAQDFSDKATQKILSVAGKMQLVGNQAHQQVGASSPHDVPDTSPSKAPKQPVQDIQMSIKIEEDDDESMMQQEPPHTPANLARMAFKGGSQQGEQQQSGGVEPETTLSPRDLVSKHEGASVFL